MEHTASRSSIQADAKTVENTETAVDLVRFRVTTGLTAQELCCTSLEHTCTVRDLKRKIELSAGVPAKEQRLLLGKRIMKDCACLEDFLLDVSAAHVEVSLLRLHPSEDPDTRRKDFTRRYLDHPMYHSNSSNRWEFHQARVSTGTDLNTGWDQKKQLNVKLQLDANQAVTFNLCSLDFPLSELFDTFSEQTGLPIADLHFSFQGKRLQREDTPHLCGMEPCDIKDAHVIDVERADGQRRQRLLGILNSMGDSVRLQPCTLSSVEELVLGADMLSKTLLFLPLEDLLSTTVVSTFWFHGTQRLSLMLQLRHGDLAFTTAPPKEYSAWLSSVFGHSQQLALVEAQSRHKEVEIWHGLNVTKEKARTAYRFTKAAGCTTMKTVAVAGLSADFEQQWLSLHSSKAKFMADCQEWCDRKDRVEHIQTGGNEKIAPVQEQEQKIPKPGDEHFSAEAVSPEFRAIAVELFRRYFSPDMYFIFPLMVGKEVAFGLDFRSTTTTLFFVPQSRQPRSSELRLPPSLKASSVQAPAGACSWRFRWPLLPEPLRPDFPELKQPLPLLEVLFIAVWEEERYQVHGGSLVGDLEEKAHAAGVKMMYVEIGLEQPKARRFWRKQGFGKAVRKEMTESQKRELQEAEEQEDAPMPLVALPDEQFDFFESNCLRFSDTSQFVKLFE